MERVESPPTQAVATTVEPAPQVQTPPATGGSCDIVQNFNWDTSIAYAVCMAESGGDPTADNTGLNQDGTNDKGLMQINSIHVASGLITDEGRLDPAQNLQAAYVIYLGSGWSAWSSYNAGKHLKYL